MYECLIYEKLEEGVALITLNRPHRLNAVSAQLARELGQALDEVEGDGEVRVTVLTGAPRADGRPCFSAGGDLHDLAGQEKPPVFERMAGAVPAMMDRSVGPSIAGFCERLETTGKPSIAAIDGVCTAGGLELALACDIRVAAETAQMSELHMKNLGGLSGAGMTTRLARTVGPAWAKEIMFTGEPLNGHAAVAIGLANHVLPSDKLLEGAIALARRFAAMRPGAVAVAKAAMSAAMDLDLERALRYSYIGQEVLSAKEGARSFTQKQPPPHTRV